MLGRIQNLVVMPVSGIGELFVTAAARASCLPAAPWLGRLKASRRTGGTGGRPG